MREHISRPHKETTSDSAPLEEPRPVDEGTSEDLEIQRQEVSMAIMIMMIFRKKGILVIRKMERI